LVPRYVLVLRMFTILVPVTRNAFTDRCGATLKGTPVSREGEDPMSQENPLTPAAALRQARGGVFASMEERPVQLF
jgi:hypothetical protein